MSNLQSSVSPTASNHVRQAFGSQRFPSISTTTSFGDEEDEDIISMYNTTPGFKIVTPDRKQTPRSNARRPDSTGSSRDAGFVTGYSPAVETPSRSYRSKTGSVLRYHTKDTTDWNVDATNTTQWEVAVSTSCAKRLDEGFKYMFQKTAEVSEVFNEIINKVGFEIIANNKLEEPQNLKESSTEDSVYIGRIRNFEGRLTTTSVYLEGNLEESEGHVIALDLSALDEYYLYPGQVVAVTGNNTLGKCLQVSKLHVPVQSSFPEEPIGVTSESGAMDVLIACGPYTPTDSMMYEPLKDLLKVIKETRPQICILVGPFLDSQHPIIESESFMDTFEQMFVKIMEDFDSELADVNTHLIFVSSCKDAHHDNVYPTPPYTHRFKNVRATFAPDPAVVSVGGIVFAITATDILMHLAKHELSYSPLSLDRMSRLARHLLTQKNFYPLYPPEECVPFDIGLAADHIHMEHNPHVLIIPSDLKHFIKEVDGTIVVNPERLTKGSAGGTYTRMRIQVPDNDNDTPFSGSIGDIALGEIMKI